jgi:hypothetical protein
MHRHVLGPATAACCVAAFALLGTWAPARGAEPTATPSGIEGMPGAGREDVVRALRKVHHKYGEHAVQIETQLLVNAMRNGSLRATAVRVEGVKPYRDKRYLGFDVETGLVFDTTTRDERTRIEMLWTTILVPTLERLTELRLPADGIRVALHYHHRPYRSLAELRASIDEPGTPEETDFYVLTPDVSDLVDHRLTPHTLIARTQVTVDGGARAIAALAPDVPTAPGPE